jgi:hypothetical protein
VAAELESVEVPLELEQAADEWKEFRYRTMTGRGRSSTGAAVNGLERRRVEGRVAFEPRGLGRTLVTLRPEGDDGAVDVDDRDPGDGPGATLAATLAAYAEFVEGRLG